VLTTRHATDYPGYLLFTTNRISNCELQLTGVSYEANRCMFVFCVVSQQPSYRSTDSTSTMFNCYSTSHKTHGLKDAKAREFEDSKDHTDVCGEVPLELHR
jgi:hypothetical protein